MSVKPLNHHYSMENTASIYDEEAMTALELAGRTTAKVNETVEAFNKLETNTNTHLANQDKTIADRMQAQDNAITKMNNETMPAKVTEEFEKNLDNGTFEDMVNQYAGNLESRVDSLLGTVTEGSTTMDAEVIDGRTDNYGYTRGNLGNSIRAQIFDAFSLGSAETVVGLSVKMTVTYGRDGNGGADVKFNSSGFSLLVSNSTIVNETIYFDTTKGDHASEITSNVTNNGDGSFTIYLPHSNGLAYNVNTKKLHIRPQNRQQYGDIMLLYNAFGRIIGGVLLTEHIVKQIETLNTMDSTLSDRQLKMLRSRHWYFYIAQSSRGLVKTEIESGTGAMFIQLPIKIEYINYEGRGTIQFSETTINDYTWPRYVTEINDTYIKFRIPANSILCFDTVSRIFMITDVKQMSYHHVLVAINNWSLLSEGNILQFLQDQRLEKIENTIKYEGISIGRTADVASLLNTDSRVDSFIFATDLHPVKKDTEWWHTVNTYVKHLKANDELLPLNFVLTGGDWLNEETTPEEACHALGVIYGQMRSAFGDRGHLILGNHDTNYLGRASETAEANTGKLSQTLTNKLWYTDRGGKSYYDFDTPNAKYFVFDSGVDWSNDIDSYKVEQLKYFAETLKTNDKPFIVLTVHIIEHPFVNKMCEIANAFNSRTSITYEGVTYNFAGCTGVVKMVLGGHLHRDLNGINNTIPYFATKNYWDGQSFDFCVIDFDGGVVNFIREGTGEDRTFKI